MRHEGRAAGGRGTHFPTPRPLWRCVLCRSVAGGGCAVGSFEGGLGWFPQRTPEDSPEGHPRELPQGPAELLSTKAVHGNLGRMGGVFPTLPHSEGGTTQSDRRFRCLVAVQTQRLLRDVADLTRWPGCLVGVSRLCPVVSECQAHRGIPWGIPQGPPRGIPLGAVSYTHLTLPTIYSV